MFSALVLGLFVYSHKSRALRYSMVFNLRNLGYKEISLVNTIMKWETQHRPYIEQLETRALRLAKGDLMRLSDLENPQVVERLKVHESFWNNAKNEWASTSEEESFREKGLQAFSPEVSCAPYDY